MKKLKLMICLLLLIVSGNILGQVTEYPYLCSFETGPNGAVMVNNEPFWTGDTDWVYNSSTSVSGTFCIKTDVSSTSDLGYLIYLNFDCSNQSNIQPSFWYWSSNQSILVRVLGRSNYGSWVVLKDWFTPAPTSWQQVDYTEMSNLNIFDNQAVCHFGIVTKKNTASGALRLDDVQILTAGGGSLTCTWLANAASSDWHTAANWDVAAVPQPADDVVIPYTAANNPVVGTANAACNNLNIQPGGRLSINPGFQLDVSGNLIVESDAATDGSLLDLGTLNVGGNSIYQRYVDAYANSADGWHLVSSPVNSFNVAGSDFDPGANDDLYRWDEASWQWINYKTTPFNFVNGRGYLVAYENSGIRSFTGNFNNTDILMQDLSYGTGNGWHLLGNPYPCALKWNDNNWNLNNIEGIAKIYNEAAGNYIDLAANGIIPPTQGFFVRAASAVNSIKIPAASRTHDATAFYKNEIAFPAVRLKVESPQTGFYDINNLCFIPGASSSYDMMYDGQKMFGREEAPQMYILCESGEFLSTSALPPGNYSNIELYFKAGTEGAHILTAGTMNKPDVNTAIYLEDIVNDSIINLNIDSIYVFTASVDDPALRFRIRTEDASDIYESRLSDGYVYQSDGRICIRDFGKSVDVFVYELSGKLIHSERTSGGNACIRNKMSNGIYLVKINNKVYKLIVSHEL